MGVVRLIPLPFHHLLPGNHVGQAVQMHPIKRIFTIDY